jgi:inorganic triphosphatase YgiF
MAIDRGTVESRGKTTPLCEIELELVSGKVADIFALTRALQKDHELCPAITSKAERGYKLYLDEPLISFRAKPALINSQMMPVEAFRSIALGCLEHFQRNELGLQINGAPEFVHQARVALRRLRSAIKLFSPVLPPEFVSAYGKTWQTLAGALGDARNWDVFLDETLPPIQSAFPDNKDTHYLRNKLAP